MYGRTEMGLNQSRTERPQKQSLLLGRLPPEIRLMNWQMLCSRRLFVIGGKTFSLVGSQKSHSHRQFYCWDVIKCIAISEENAIEAHNEALKGMPFFSEGKLLRVCKQMYIWLDLPLLLHFGTKKYM
jgi:hypothetical protein